MIKIVEQCINNLQNFLQKIEVKKIAIAVSGGSDSIALLHIVSNWAKNNNIECVVLTVDHNLRAASKNDLTLVAKLANKLGNKIVALSWKHDEISTNIQEKARNARYELMTRVCHKLNITTLLTAHHLDDTIETYLMRKTRNSSVFGLSSSTANFLNDIRIIRPLYNIYKSDIIDYLHKNNITWSEDESNQLDKYERNRVRKYVTKLSQEAKDNIVKEIESNDQACKILNALLIQAIAECIKISNFGYAIINTQKFLTYELPIQRQILFYITAIISGKNTIPRYRTIYKILNAIINNTLDKVTLHHCVLQRTEKKIFIYKEKFSIQTNICNLSLRDSKELYKNNSNISSVYWNNRFQVIISSNIKNLHITVLNRKECNEIIKVCDLGELQNYSSNICKEILSTIPVIKNLEKIVAIPNISYYDDEKLTNNVKVIFKPNFISRFTHFI